MDMICIVCPMGCKMEAEKVGDKITVSGNTCPRGERYAISELTAPKRVITTTIALDESKRLAVKSNKGLPKENLMRYMRLIKREAVHSPVKAGQVIIEDIGGTGVDIIASCSAE